MQASAHYGSLVSAVFAPSPCYIIIKDMQVSLLEPVQAAFCSLSEGINMRGASALDTVVFPISTYFQLPKNPMGILDRTYDK